MVMSTQYRVQNKQLKVYSQMAYTSSVFDLVCKTNKLRRQRKAKISFSSFWSYPIIWLPLLCSDNFSEVFGVDYVCMYHIMYLVYVCT